jgi:glycosyltransferase involved in cell wall biosynthesis
MISVCIGSVRSGSLRAAIESIRRQSWPDWELIVVGQGADPALRAVGEAAMAGDRRVRYLHLDRRGVSLARNVAVQAARGDIIAITDDDCEARADWLATLAQCFAAEPDVDVVGGALLAPDPERGGLAKCPSQIPAEALYDPIASGGRAPDGWDWWTANVAFRRTVLERGGPFDEYFGPGAFFRVATDTEYKLRLEAKGVRMRSTPRSVVFHTDGYRYGFRQLWRRSMNYSWGHGALAGKLTLLGDPRGREWLASQRRATVGWLRRRRPDRFALGLVQLWTFMRGYRRCVRNFQVDPERGVLQPRSSA